MKTLPLLFCAALSACAALCAPRASAVTSTPEGWLDDYDAALAQAAAEDKLVVMDFSGSDWCGWCRRLDEEVFSTEAFRRGAAGRYVLLMVDTPRDKSLLTPKAAEENPKLVRKFGVEGFPSVVVVDKRGEEVCRLGYERGGPERYLERLDEEIRDAPEVKKYIKPIEDVLCRHDREMERESEAAVAKAQEELAKPPKGAGREAHRRFRREAERRIQEVLFGEVYPKYVPLYEKAFAEARAMKVPENMEARKKELIEGQEESFGALKDAIRRYEESKRPARTTPAASGAEAAP